MNCPVCDRSLAPTLSICPSCGAMMNDTVREELQPKISPGSALNYKEQAPPAIIKSNPLHARPITPSPVPQKRIETAGLNTSKTSPTLVDFQNKNATLPDWRIQLQNAVQQRKGAQSENSTPPNTGTGTGFPTNGGAALKAEVVARTEPEPAQKISDPRVANAMRRIEESRKAFMEPQTVRPKAAIARPQQMRPYKFGVVSASGGAAAGAAPARVISTPVAPKPMLVPSAPAAEKRDTNKLLPIALPEAPPPPAAVVAKPAAKEDIPYVERIVTEKPQPEFAEIKRIRITAEVSPVDNTEGTDVQDEIEDLAPFSMRFGAGLFDLIIGGFASMLLLSPLAFSSGNWFTASGMLTFAATCAIVMFLYMTVCLGFFGKTMGMRLFSLELVDAIENEYPTLRQAAINSSVFLITTVFGGAGFLTIFFNEENRALHDLLSGTIIVKEF